MEQDYSYLLSNRHSLQEVIDLLKKDGKTETLLYHWLTELRDSREAITQIQTALASTHR